MSDNPMTDTVPAYTQVRSFWELMLTAVLLGLVGAFAGLVFLGVTGLGADWYGEPGLGWFDGEVWWIAVAAGAGLIVGILRRAFDMPAKTPGLIEDLKSEYIDTSMVGKVVAVSAVSLIGGASLGPEVALGQMGGGTGSYIAERRKLDDDAKKEYSLSGMAGAFGGLFSSSLMATILVLEISAPPRSRRGNTFFASIVSSSVSLGLYFAIAGSVFLGLYEVPQYEYEDWNLLVGFGLGLLSVVVVLLTFAIVAATKRLISGLKVPSLLLPVIGGLLFGLVGWVLPLTNFTGSDQLDTVLQNGSALGVALLVAILIGKMFTFAVSSGTGFIGGPIFPILFIGGTTGIIVNQIFPEIPLALAFTCMLAAVPGSIVAAPFSLVLLVAILTQVGAIQTSPIVIAVATSFLTVSLLKFVVSQRREAAAAGG